MTQEKASSLNKTQNGHNSQRDSVKKKGGLAMSCAERGRLLADGKGVRVSPHATKGGHCWSQKLSLLNIL